MRVAQFVNTIESTDGGPARNASELNAHLNEMSAGTVPLYVMTPAEPNALQIIGRTSSGVCSLPLSPPAGPGRRIRQLWRAVRAAHDSDMIILHGYYLWWTPFVALAARLSGAGVLLTPHGALTPHQRATGRLKKFIWELAPGLLTRRAVTTFVTGSKQEATDLARTFPSVPRAHGGIGTSTPLAQRAKTVHSPLRLISLGRLVEKKRVDLAIDATSELRSRGHDVSLCIYGSGALADDLRRHAATVGADDIVTFHGHLEDEHLKWKVLHDSDVLLFPSDDENFGIVLLESLAQATPAVVSSHVAAADDLRPGGFIVIADQSPRQIADAVHRIAFSYAEFSSAALAAASDAGWPAVTERWLRLMKEHVRG